LPQPCRESRFRRYDSEDVARLHFMRRARQLGFTLDEVRAFLRLAEPRERPRALKRPCQRSRRRDTGEDRRSTRNRSTRNGAGAAGSDL
jgi:MerR family mercuric resistance operon transcriptional regulator